MGANKFGVKIFFLILLCLLLVSLLLFKLGFITLSRIFQCHRQQFDLTLTILIILFHRLLEHLNDRKYEETCILYPAFQHFGALLTLNLVFDRKVDYYIVK